MLLRWQGGLTVLDGQAGCMVMSKPWQTLTGVRFGSVVECIEAFFVSKRSCTCAATRRLMTRLHLRTSCPVPPDRMTFARADA